MSRLAGIALRNQLLKWLEVYQPGKREAIAYDLSPVMRDPDDHHKIQQPPELSSEGSMVQDAPRADARGFAGTPDSDEVTACCFS